MVSRYPTPAMALPFTDYSAENADDRLAKAETVLAWVESQWEDSDAD
jgi:HEPN domain-containing protein